MDYVAQSFFLSSFKKGAPLSPIPYGTPFLLAFLTTVSKARTHMHTRREEEEENEEGEEEEEGSVCTGINRDLHTGTCGLMFQVKC